MILSPSLKVDFLDFRGSFPAPPLLRPLAPTSGESGGLQEQGIVRPRAAGGELGTLGMLHAVETKLVCYTGCIVRIHCL
jgi:hypothetical protein